MTQQESIQIVSGGQTGVDRAALDAARILGLPTGGWCPKGRLAEDGSIPIQYPLKETDTSIYSQRTEKNVVDSHGTLILYHSSLSGGTALTKVLVKKHNRPLFLCNLDSPSDFDAVISWIMENQIKVLNIAGPRESGEPGIYLEARQYLAALFYRL